MNGRQRGAQLRDMIYAAYEAAQTTRRPQRLRPSAIGHQCSRYLWLNLRWADKLEMFSGRMLRLFETGHSQEDRLLVDLKRVGATPLNRDPEDASKQIGWDALDGHIKGYVDTVASDVPHASGDWVIGECKSHSKASFSKLEREGVEVGKPEHYVQVQLYLYHLKITEGLYLGVCKDTDEIYCEFLPYNEDYVVRLLRKSDMAIFSPRAPSRIHKSAEYFVCKMCSATGVCHGNDTPERSCRTCRECQPLRSDDQLGEPAPGAWGCLLHGHVLSLDQQREGCPSHRFHQDVVPGETGDRDATDPIYTMRNGQIWTDAGPQADSIRAPLPSGISAVPVTSPPPAAE